MPASKTAKTTATPLALLLAQVYEKFPSLPDGIYLNLNETRYHADTALGSSTIRDLLKGANLYWYKSFLNPNRKKDKKTPSKILGSATHKLLLEGRKAYDALYVRGPYDADDEDLSPSEKGALTKAAKKDLLEGQELLVREDYDFVLGCKAILDADPELQGCLDNALTEVSVFWTRPDGVRVKARLDAFKLRGIGDIKTIANERERDLEQACKLDISTYRYDIPAEHYSEGRRQMAQLLAGGKVFIEADDIAEDGGRDVTPLRKDEQGADQILSFLARCVAQKDFGFQLVFIPKQGAPDAWSCILSPGNPILQGAKVDIETAISYFRMALETFGLDKRWVAGREVAELDLNDMPYGFGRVSPRAKR